MTPEDLDTHITQALDQGQQEHTAQLDRWVGQALRHQATPKRLEAPTRQELWPHAPPGLRQALAVGIPVAGGIAGTAVGGPVGGAAGATVGLEFTRQMGMSDPAPEDYVWEAGLSALGGVRPIKGVVGALKAASWDLGSLAGRLFLRSVAHQLGGGGSDLVRQVTTLVSSPAGRQLIETASAANTTLETAMRIVQAGKAGIAGGVVPLTYQEKQPAIPEGWQPPEEEPLHHGKTVTVPPGLRPRR